MKSYSMRRKKRYRNFECSNFIGRNQFNPLRHTMLAKLICVRRIEKALSPAFKCECETPSTLSNIFVSPRIEGGVKW